MTAAGRTQVLAWHCLGCDQTGTTDSSAEKHTKTTRHTTITITTATPTQERTQP